MEPSVEFLVHVSEPSGAETDAQHRDFASACLNFEPATRIRIYPDDTDGSRPRNGEFNVLNQVTRNSRDGGGVRSRDDGCLRDDSDFNEVQEEHSFGNGEDDDSDVDDDFGDEGDTTELIGSPTKLDESDSWETPPETVPDSQPACSPPWDAQHNDDSDFESTTGEISMLEPIAGTQLDDLEATTTTSRIEPTQAESFGAESDFASQASFRSTGDVERNRSPDVGPIKRAQIEDQFSFSSAAAASPSKRLCVSGITDAGVPAILRGSINQIPSSDAAEAPSSSATGSSSLPELPMEIHAPLPEARAEQFVTHVTPTLKMISEELTRYFKPAYQARKLGTLERGYWYLQIPILIDGHETAPDKHDKMIARSDKSHSRRVTGPWTIEFYLQFWSYLTDFVGQGRAGWGVWCYCDISSTHEQQQHQHMADSIRRLDVRVYGWGEIASHIYLLLFMASHRRIKGIAGVEWRDGKGEAIVRMD